MKMMKRRTTEEEEEAQFLLLLLLLLLNSSHLMYVCDARQVRVKSDPRTYSYSWRILLSCKTCPSLFPSSL